MVDISWAVKCPLGLMTGSLIVGGICTTVRHIESARATTPEEKENAMGLRSAGAGLLAFGVVNMVSAVWFSRYKDIQTTRRTSDIMSEMTCSNSLACVGGVVEIIAGGSLWAVLNRSEDEYLQAELKVAALVLIIFGTFMNATGCCLTSVSGCIYCIDACDRSSIR